MRKRILVGKDLREEPPTKDFAFPIYVTDDSLFNFEQNILACHWHSDLEMTVVHAGQMEYHINDKVFTAEKGTGILANAGVLHFAYPLNGEDCSYSAVIFQPRLIYGYEGSATERRYMDSILHNPKLDAVFFQESIPWQREALSAILHVAELYRKGEVGHELLITGEMCRFWALLYQNLGDEAWGEVPASITTLKGILSFLHENYDKKLSLEQLAGAGSVSKGECCRLFQKTLKQSPFSYLHFYRIQKSIPLLLRGKLNITEISECVGFHGVSYFSEIFKKVMACSPRDYRKQATGQLSLQGKGDWREQEQR